MKYQQLFTEEEWTTLESSVLWVFEAIAKADGKRDIKEWEAMSIIHRRSDYMQNPFAREVLESFFYNMDHIHALFKEDDLDVIEGFAKIPYIIDDKIPNDVAVGFKKSLLAIGTYIANASGEMGSSKICDEEAEALKEISDNLGLTDEEIRSKPTISSIVESLFKARAL
ncbi:MAG: hypothetical protein QG635_1826 [Bacteroidota bacterium]|nr:hypothetical protein [Bacteroidota bacterium]